MPNPFKRRKPQRLSDLADPTFFTNLFGQTGPTSREDVDKLLSNAIVSHLQRALEYRQAGDSWGENLWIDNAAMLIRQPMSYQSSEEILAALPPELREMLPEDLR